MSTNRTPSAAARERLADLACRAGIGPFPALEIATANLKAAKAMAANLGVITGNASAWEDADPADLSALAWAVADQIEAALIVLADLEEKEKGRPSLKSVPRGDRK
jgi:hypothetical protein